MKKQEKFSAAEQKMQETGISREKAETQTEFESRKEYPFEVVYVDGSRSRQPEDKKSGVLLSTAKLSACMFPARKNGTTVGNIVQKSSLAV